MRDSVEGAFTATTCFTRGGDIAIHKRRDGAIHRRGDLGQIP
jgi:hypothetical protein